MYLPWVAKALTTGLMLFFLGLCAIDLAFDREGLRPVGQRVATWSKRYPIFAAVVSFVAGAMIGHFFLQCLGNPACAP